MKDLGQAERFVAGAVGEPGRRTFLFEIASGEETIWLIGEKRQVAAMAIEAIQILREHGLEGAGAGELQPLREPGQPLFRVTEIQLSYSESSGLFTFALLPEEDDPAAGVSFEVTPATVDAMARGAIASVESGRPACPKCGLAIDPDGHPCPTDNGDLRGHQP